jgi:hypothetical protein
MGYVNVARPIITGAWCDVPPGIKEWPCYNHSIHKNELAAWFEAQPSVAHYEGTSIVDTLIKAGILDVTHYQYTYYNTPWGGLWLDSDNQNNQRSRVVADAVAGRGYMSQIDTARLEYAVINDNAGNYGASALYYKYINPRLSIIQVGTKERLALNLRHKPGVYLSLRSNAGITALTTLLEWPRIDLLQVDGDGLSLLHWLHGNKDEINDGALDILNKTRVVVGTVPCDAAEARVEAALKAGYNAQLWPNAQTPTSLITPFSYSDYYIELEAGI